MLASPVVLASSGEMLTLPWLPPNPHRDPQRIRTLSSVLANEAAALAGIEPAMAAE